jgi:hypothetical protein
MAASLLLLLLGYTLKQHYSSLWQFYGGGADISMADMDDGNVSLDAIIYRIVCLLSGNIGSAAGLLLGSTG